MTSVLMSEKPAPLLPEWPHSVSGIDILPVSSNPWHIAFTGRHPGPPGGVPGGQLKPAGGVYGTLQAQTPPAVVTRGSAFTVQTFSTISPLSVWTPPTTWLRRPVRLQPPLVCRHRLAALVKEFETARPCGTVTFCVIVACRLPLPSAFALNSRIAPFSDTKSSGLPCWKSVLTL